MKFSLNIKRSEQLANICGSLDKNLENIANNLNVSISNKGADFNIKGNNSAKAVAVLQDLLSISEKKSIDFSDIDLCIKSLNSPNGETKSVTIKTSKKHIHIRSTNQQKYVNSIIDNDAVFAVGPAGTGKTLFATEMAVKYFLLGTYEKLIFTRPSVSVDEDLGYLPGTLEEKMAPWVRPIYDILYNFITPKEVSALLEDKMIEISPLGYMRGRTFKNCWIVADEMQNSTTSQMKMLLTRLGENSRLVITGDLDQHDRHEEMNGLDDFLNKFKGKRSSSITSVEFEKDDIQRESVVKEVLDIYGGDIPAQYNTFIESDDST